MKNMTQMSCKVWRNHQKTISRWKNEPNQTSPLTSHHSRRTFMASIFGGFATWWSQIRQNYLPFFIATQDGQNREEGGVICGLI
jgi:hypothetical protein